MVAVWLEEPLCLEFANHTGADTAWKLLCERLQKDRSEELVEEHPTGWSCRLVVGRTSPSFENSAILENLCQDFSEPVISRQANQQFPPDLQARRSSCAKSHHHSRKVDAACNSSSPTTTTLCLVRLLSSYNTTRLPIYLLHAVSPRPGPSSPDGINRCRWRRHRRRSFFRMSSFASYPLYRYSEN